MFFAKSTPTTQPAKVPTTPMKVPVIRKILRIMPRVAPIVLVRDKSHDIAILRTMGATRGMIMRIFLMTGTFIGVVGTLFGCLVGVLFAQNIEIIRTFLQYVSGAELFPAEVYFLSHLPSKIDPMEVLVVAAVAFGLSFLMTLYPSWRAARLDPVEALRYE